MTSAQVIVDQESIEFVAEFCEEWIGGWKGRGLALAVRKGGPPAMSRLVDLFGDDSWLAEKLQAKHYEAPVERYQGHLDTLKVAEVMATHAAPAGATRPLIRVASIGQCLDATADVVRSFQHPVAVPAVFHTTPGVMVLSGSSHGMFTSDSAKEDVFELDDRDPMDPELNIGLAWDLRMLGTNEPEAKALELNTEFVNGPVRLGREHGWRVSTITSRQVVGEAMRMHRLYLPDKNFDGRYESSGKEHGDLPDGIKERAAAYTESLRGVIALHAKMMDEY